MCFSMNRVALTGCWKTGWLTLETIVITAAMRHGIKLLVPPRNRNYRDMLGALLEFNWRQRHAEDLWNRLIVAFQTIAY
jgi:hypothetical protein